MQIVGIMLLRDEDVFAAQAIENVRDFCDRLVILDNKSRDHTPEIVQRLADAHSKIESHRIQSPAESHGFIQDLAGSPTWVFGVDGDELYDPAGLAAMRERLQRGEFDEWWGVFGNVLNCTSLDVAKRTASGYLSPPCRSMTKFYNFAAIDAWEGPCSERLHDGTIHFRAGYDARKRCALHQRQDWDDADFRCLHTCFLRRSSRDPEPQGEVAMRLNIPDLLKLPWWRRLASQWGRPFGLGMRSPLKRDKYMRGERVEKDVSAFFPQAADA